MMREESRADFVSALNHVVSTLGDQPAFRYDDRVLTYAEFSSAVERKVATYSLEIGDSATVGVVADDPIEFLTDVFALLKLQAFCVLLAADITGWELERLSRMVRVSHMVSTAPVYERSICLGGRVLACLDDEHEPVVQGPCLGFLTSGTTGHPRIAVRSERALLVEAMAMRLEFHLNPGCRLATLVPLHHSFGFGDCALTGILAGVEVCSYPRMHPSAYLAHFEQLRIDIAALVPAQLRLLAEACEAPVFERLSVLSAGAPLDARTAQLASERLRCAVGQVYGTSETGVIAVAPPGEGAHCSVGAPSHHVEIRLDPLPPDWVSAGSTAATQGIVAVRSEALFAGYVTPDGIDRRPIRSDWFSTGDCARLVEGRLQLSGRLSSAINVAGVKVSPEEVEAALLEFPSVRGALVTGMDDALAHQRMKAFVTPADVDLEQLRRFCEERLSVSKCPHYYEAVESLATTPSGKVIRSQWVGAGLER